MDNIDICTGSEEAKNSTAIAEIYQRLHKHIEGTFSIEECALVEDAFKLALDIIGDERLPDGQFKLEHSIGVATIAASEMGLAVHSVIASLLHNIKISEETVSFTDIEEKFGEIVKNIIEGLQKINDLDKETLAMHSENFRRLMMTLSGDIRVILVKLADQLQDMRNLHYFDKDKRIAYAHETDHLYSPFAHRLGLYKINAELQDLSLMVRHPKVYNGIKKSLDESIEFRNNFISKFVAPLEEKIKAAGFDFTLKARTKSIFSIWNKMKGSKIDLPDIYDIFAMRVILKTAPTHTEERSDCWRVFSIVTEHYTSNPNRYRDWLTLPKKNGYESLHTTVLGPYNKWIEVQIRTERMNDIAENGMAAHWRYKGGAGSNDLDNWLKSVRDILENPEMNPLDFIDEFKTDVYKDEIFAFTPNGDLQRLSAGASLLDFAYAIHSNLGDKCVGGSVNGKRVTIDYKVKNGDQISIDKNNSQKPSRDWLDFVTSSKARTRIKASLDKEKRAEAANGKEILQRKLKNWKLEYNDLIIQKVLNHFKLKQSVDLYFQIAIGKLDPLEIKELLSPKEEDESNDAKSMLAATLSAKEVKNLSFGGNNDDYLIIDKNIKGINYELSQCCNPVSGDNIFGFVTILNGIKIHRESCPNAPDMKDRYPYRIIKTAWRDASLLAGDKKISFRTSLSIVGRDGDSILSDITLAITKDFGVKIISIKADSKAGGVFTCNTTIVVYSVVHLDGIMKRINSVKGVDAVNRIDGLIESSQR